MLEISFLSAELIFTAVWLLVRISVWKRQNSIDWKREAVFPLRMNLIPFAHLFDYDSIRDVIWNVAGNAVMFIPGRHIQTTEQLLESGCSGCVYFSVHRDPAAAFSIQGFRYRRSDSEYAGSSCRLWNLCGLQTT